MTEKLDINGVTEEQFLAEYDISRYPQPSVTVDNVIFTVEDNDLRILLVKRGGHPFLGLWALPGGFMGINESTDEAVRREVQEETGIDLATGVGFFEQLRTFSAVGRDPRGRILSVAHMTLLPAKHIGGMRAGDDASDAAWFSVTVDGEDITLTQVAEDGDVDGDAEVIRIGITGTTDNLSFDHDAIIRCAVSRLMAKIEYSCIAFALLDDPASFTLTELRHVYEAVTGRHHDMGNFQRTFKKTFRDKGLADVVGVTETRGRPATAYAFVGDGYEIIVR